jgi:tellurite resistance protein TerC
MRAGQTFETTRNSKEPHMLPWIALGTFVLVALAIDFRADSHKVPSMRSSLLWSLLWTGLGVGFAGVLLLTGAGATAAEEYLAGFLVEKSLSLDNLFVFAVLFAFLAVPPEERHRVLIAGIALAVVLRLLFILVGAAMLDTFSFTTYVLGGLLALTAYKIAKGGGEHIDPENTRVMRLLKRVAPNAGPVATALVLVAAFDVMFAVDSIPAIFAITRDTFIVFAANAFSLLGMISLYFLLDGMLERFRHLHFGLAAILGWVAAKMLLADVWHPPITLTLAVIVGALATAAVTSVLAERRERRRGGAVTQRPAPESAG